MIFWDRGSTRELKPFKDGKRGNITASFPKAVFVISGCEVPTFKASKFICNQVFLPAPLQKILSSL